MLSDGDASLRRDFEALTVSRRLVRTVSQKLRKKATPDQDSPANDGFSLKCLTLMGRGGGCKVGADTGDDFVGDSGGRRRSSTSSDEAGRTPYKPICGGEETGVDCFFREMFWKKHSSRRDLQIEAAPIANPLDTSKLHMFLPDDILELCLVRLPLTSLMNARLVCKKWKNLTTSPRFLTMRWEGLYRTPWLFLFGTVRDGCCSGEIHAFDSCQDKWHKIDADILKGRFMFSVQSVHDDEIYVVGGRSSLGQPGRLDWSSFKTHKGVTVFSPVTKSWRKVASMRYARSMPVLGASEVGPDFSSGHHHHHQERRFPRSRIGGVSDVYEDPHRLSLRRQHNEVSFTANRKSHSHSHSQKFMRQRSSNWLNAKCSKRYVLIAVGGLGPWDEPLDSGEIYDPLTNKWSEIQRLPVDFGAVSSGVVCNGIFYVYSEIDKLMGYDIDRGFWMGIQISPFPPRVVEYYPKLVASNGRLFMLSVSWCEGDGRIGQRNKAVRKMWELDLVYMSWSEVSVHPDAPMDWNAVFVAGRGQIYGIEMFKIFGQLLDFSTVCDVSDSGTTSWRHVSRSHVGHELDASSCMMKSLSVLHL
ncbi:unnamed protein product [Linum tenue]|uniref:F-box domain-containing protein n=1 Tax=Linum tenue TaxID=586396 RepID=A0AAV0LJV2_9ROSI|nr:unnamed protein product [Linum tenue]